MRLQKVESFSAEINNLHTKNIEKLNASIEEIQRGKKAYETEISNICGRVNVKLMQTTELFNQALDKISKTDM